MNKRSIPKHPFIYEAIYEAFDSFKSRYGFHPIEMIAEEIGLLGATKKQQLYNKLNYMSAKYLTLDEFIILLKILKEANKIPLRALANEFGYGIEPRGAGSVRCDITHVVMQTNIALEVELGEFAKEVMAAVEDGEVDYDEAVRLRKKVREFKDILDGLDEKLIELTRL